MSSMDNSSHLNKITSECHMILILFPVQAMPVGSLRVDGELDNLNSPKERFALFKSMAKTIDFYDITRQSSGTTYAFFPRMYLQVTSIIRKFSYSHCAQAPIIYTHNRKLCETTSVSANNHLRQRRWALLIRHSL